MSRPRLAAALTIALAASPAWALADGGLSYSQAQKQPASRIAGLVLKQFSTQLVAVRRPQAGAFSGETLSTLELSTLPASAGFPGLCSAKMVLVEMAYDDPANAGRNAPARAKDISLVHVYKVVGSTDPLPDTWNDAYGRRLEADCNRLGAGFEFFSATNAAAAWRGARVIGELIPGADGKARSSLPVTCIPAPGARPKDVCDAKVLLPKLGLSTLANVEETPCQAQAPDGTSCMTLTFVIDQSGNQGTDVKLNVVLRQREPHPVEILEASLSSQRWIAD